MSGDILNEAYERFRHTGPEWGADVLTNHGPMAAEVLVRRGREDDVEGWVDAYLRRLDDLPAPSDPITDGMWRDALGDGRRIADWTVYFERKMTEAPFRASPTREARCFTASASFPSWLDGRRRWPRCTHRSAPTTPALRSPTWSRLPRRAT